jgi:hypothetical protein
MPIYATLTWSGTVFTCAINKQLDKMIAKGLITFFIGSKLKAKAYIVG